MISLEQVRALEARVEKAVAFIASLRAENAALKDGLLEAELRTEAAEARTAELEGLIKEFQKDQERIEEGIVQALRKLDAFEDVVHAAVKPPATVEAVPVPEPVRAQIKAQESVPAVPPMEAEIEPEVDAGSVSTTEAGSSDEAETDEPGSDQSDGLDIF